MVVQLDRVHANSACGAEADDVELDVRAAHRLDGPALCHGAAHRRLAGEGSATDKGRHAPGERVKERV